MVITSAQVLMEEGRQEGLKEGLKEGLQKGYSEILLELLETRFGSLSAPIITTVKALSPEGLKELAHRVLIAQSLADLQLESLKSN